MCCLCAANAVHLRGGVCALPTPCIRALPRKPYAGPIGGGYLLSPQDPELYYPRGIILGGTRLIIIIITIIIIIIIIIIIVIVIVIVVVVVIVISVIVVQKSEEDNQEQACKRSGSACP